MPKRQNSVLTPLLAHYTIQIPSPEKEFMERYSFDPLSIIIEFVLNPRDLSAMCLVNKMWCNVLSESGKLTEWKKRFLFLKSLKQNTRLYEPKNKGVFYWGSSFQLYHHTELNAGISSNIILSFFKDMEVSLEELVTFYQEDNHPNSKLALLQKCLWDAQLASNSTHYWNINAQFLKEITKKPLTTYLLNTLVFLFILASAVTILNLLTNQLMAVTCSEKGNKYCIAFLGLSVISALSIGMMALFLFYHALVNIIKNRHWKKVSHNTIADAEKLFTRKPEDAVIQHDVLQKKIREFLTSIDVKILNLDFPPIMQFKDEIKKFLTLLKNNIEKNLGSILLTKQSLQKKNTELKKIVTEYCEKDIEAAITAKANDLKAKANIMTLFLEKRSEIPEEERNCLPQSH